MSSRAEEKERRRKERLEHERAAARSAQRVRLVQLGLGGVLLVAILVAVGIAVFAGGGGGDKSKSASSQVPKGAAAIPPPGTNVNDVQKAAAAAGCDFKEFPVEGRNHSTSPVNDYRTNPPTSGTHNPTPAQDGVYAAGNSPAKENWVHSLEHGRIVLQYKAGSAKKLQAQLETLFNEPVKGSSGYHTLLLENNTKMPFAVAAVAWTKYVGCNTVNAKTWDALRAFRNRYVDRGPEIQP
jgi:outer membrane murein-binding lipoprotein Lpp